MGSPSEAIARVESAEDSMLDGHRPWRFRRRRLLHFLQAMVAAVVVASAIPWHGAAQTASQHAAVAAIEGVVRDTAGKPVADASVTLTPKGAAAPLATRTNAAGTFVYSSLAPGSYMVHAEKAGAQSQPVAAIALAEGERRHVDLTLGQEMSFSDNPDFTVAGVTDWTAVGGHGSDNILRTSEDLARETAALKARRAEGDSTAANDAATENQLRAALAANPGSFAANRRLGAFYRKAGKDSVALPLLEAAYRLNPDDSANERDLAEALEATGDLQQARAHIQKLLARSPSADLHRMAGELDEKLGDPLAAVRAYQQATALDPSEQNYLAWGSELLVHRAVWQATEVFRSGVKAHPQSVPLLTGLGTALFAGAEYDEAARHICEASDLAPENREPYIFLGKIEMAAPTPLPCVEAKLARFVQQKPDDSLANYLYAMALEKRQQVTRDMSATAQVKDLLNKAVRLDAKCSDGYLQLGILAASAHDDAQAVQLYTKALDANPQLSEAHYRLGVAYDRLGERAKAAQEFQLHAELQKQQAAAVEQQRREIKQFVVVEGQTPKTSIQ